MREPNGRRGIEYIYLLGGGGYGGRGVGVIGGRGQGEEGSQILATRKPIKILTPPNPNILKILKTNNFHFLSRKPVVSYQRNSIHI